MKTFSTDIQMRFAHCDPAGIVYFPRYVEMFAQVIEEWFDRALGHDFHDIHVTKDWGMPMLTMELTFSKPSFLSEWLTFSLVVEKIGTTSFITRITARKGEEERARGRFVQVMRSFSQPDNIPVPDDIRTAMTAYLVAGEEARP